MNTKKDKTILFTEFGGKLPPQALELEKAVIGAILIDADAILLVTNIINSSMFYNTNNKDVYSCMEEMLSRAESIDMLTVTQKLKSKGLLEKIGGAVAVNAYANSVSTAGNIEFHARIIAQKHIARQLIKICSISMQQAYSDEVDIFEVVDGLGNGLVEINAIVNGANEIDWKNETEKVAMEIYKNSTQGVTSTGIKTSLFELDNVIAGIRPGLYVPAGRPSMGKTAFALDLACRIMEETNGHVGFFSIEMPIKQLINRMLARESGINQQRLLNCEINAVEMDILLKSGSKVSNMKLLVNDDPSISILQIQSQAKVWANKFNLKAIFVDYIQLVKGSSNQRHLEVGEVSRGLKALSKILDIPVFGLAQLGREKDGGKSMPQLSELRESGNIEQDADTVMLLYRPEYYGIEYDANNNSTKGLTKVIIAKNRNGSVFTPGVNLRSRLDINKYYDWDSYNEMAAIPEPEQQISTQQIDMRNVRHEIDNNSIDLPF